MSKTVKFTYDIGDPVVLKALKLDGTVIGMMRDTEGLSYRVVYWADGERRVEWVFPWEIE